MSREMKYTAKFRKTPPRRSSSCMMRKTPRGEALLDPRLQVEVVRHTGEHIDEICPYVPILGVLVPQVGGQVVEVQVIAVPEISF